MLPCIAFCEDGVFHHSKRSVVRHFRFQAPSILFSSIVGASRCKPDGQLIQLITPPNDKDKRNTHTQQLTLTCCLRLSEFMHQVQSSDNLIAWQVGNLLALLSLKNCRSYIGQISHQSFIYPSCFYPFIAFTARAASGSLALAWHGAAERISSGLAQRCIATNQSESFSSQVYTKNIVILICIRITSLSG